MADEDDEHEDVPGEGEEGGEAAAGGGKGGGKKKLILIIVLPLLLAIGAAAGAYFTGLADPLLAMLGAAPAEHPADGEQASEGEPGLPPVFFDLPEMLVNLNSTARKKTYLKIRVSLELEKQEDMPGVEGTMPRVIDNFQVYLRELRVEDLQGAAGMYRLREELLRRVNVAVKPAKVKDVLFKEMLIQ